MGILAGFTLPSEATGYREWAADDLNKIIKAAIAEAAPLRAKGANDVSDDDVDTLRSLAEVVADAREAQKYQTIRAADLAASEDVFGAEDTAAATADTTVVEPAPAEPAPVVAAAQRDPLPKIAPVRVGNLTGKTDPGAVVPAGQGGPGTYGRLIAAADVPGFPSGQQFADMNEVGVAVERRLSTYNSRQGQEGHAQHGVAVFQRLFPENLRQRASGDDNELLTFATLESRLPGGSVGESVSQQLNNGASLTAAAGWCAPSMTVYDLFEIEGMTGGVSLPEIQISRGGLRFTAGPDFSAIFAGAGFFHQTEAQVIAATTKPCMVIPCPSFTDVRLEVEGVCITGAILQQRGYPELVARFVRGAMAAHFHKMNAFVIAAMATGSTLVDFSPYPVATSVAADDNSATTGLLATLEMAVVDYRYKHRMAETTALEAVFPVWALAVMRADLSRRTGVQLQSISDQFLMGEMRARGVVPQFVYDYQDVAAGLATGPGGASALQQFPQELEFLLYAPGTFVRGSADVITLDTVYDAANLALNQYTALFTEEGVLVAKLGHDARRYQVPFCPTGATSSAITMNCA